MTVMARKSQYVAYLGCRHEVRYSAGEPIVGDTVYCVRCADYSVIRHTAGKYGVDCRNCRYAKSYGGQLSAMTWAEKHSRKYRLHVIDVFGPEDFHAEVCTQPILDLVDCPF